MLTQKRSRKANERKKMAGGDASNVAFYMVKGIGRIKKLATRKQSKWSRSFLHERSRQGILT